MIEPVYCHICNAEHELKQSHFYSGYCDCILFETCRHGVCGDCLANEPREREDVEDRECEEEQE